jgi:hypothetical protein
MTNVEIITITDELGGTREKVIINHGNEEFTSMLKSTYDEMIAAQSTPSL